VQLWLQSVARTKLYPCMLMLQPPVVHTYSAYMLMYSDLFVFSACCCAGGTGCLLRPLPVLHLLLLPLQPLMLLRMMLS
jgi:hypothetical protein